MSLSEGEAERRGVRKEAPDPYTREERDRIAIGINAAGHSTSCPRCGAELTLSPVNPPPGVSYVRKRALVVCPQCHRSAAIDITRR